jgi:hypothetical protein
MSSSDLLNSRENGKIEVAGWEAFRFGIAGQLRMGQSSDIATNTAVWHVDDTGVGADQSGQWA